MYVIESETGHCYFVLLAVVNTQQVIAALAAAATTTTTTTTTTTMTTMDAVAVSTIIMSIYICICVSFVGLTEIITFIHIKFVTHNCRGMYTAIMIAAVDL